MRHHLDEGGKLHFTSFLIKVVAVEYKNCEIYALRTLTVSNRNELSIN